MTRKIRYLLATGIIAPILLWFAYLVIYKPIVPDIAGIALFVMLWGTHLILAYIQNWTMFIGGGIIEPNTYSSFGRICGLLTGIIIYLVSFAKLVGALD